MILSYDDSAHQAAWYLVPQVRPSVGLTWVTALGSGRGADCAHTCSRVAMRRCVVASTCVFTGQPRDHPGSVWCDNSSC